jgi:hypothetical protein
VKSHSKAVSPQMNLTLLDSPLAELPPDEQQELALALVELLVNAAMTPSTGTQRSIGGQNESKTHK